MKKQLQACTCSDQIESDNCTKIQKMEMEQKSKSWVYMIPAKLLF